MDKNTITIEWHSVFKDIVRNIWVVVLAILVGVMGLFIASRSVYKPLYTSSALLVVNAGSTSGANSYTNYTVSSEMANVLINIFTEPSMRYKAAAYAGVDSFNGSISASVKPSTNFIEVSVSASEPQTAYELLSAVIEVYPEISENIFENAKISVLRLPSMPSSPSNSISYENRGIILSGIATVALFAIVVLSITRDTVKNEDSFKNKIDSGLIGCILHEKKHFSIKDRLRKKKKGLLIGNNAFISLRFIENFSKIAAKIEHAQRQRGSKVFVVTSISENEGKSTCAANIAVSLANRGHSVVLVDLDGKKPALHKIFNQRHASGRELGDLLNKKITPAEFKFKKCKKNSLLLAVNTKPCADCHKWFENGMAESFIEYLRNQVDYVIIDTSPFSVDSSVTDVVGHADETILIVRTDRVATPVINDSITTISRVCKNFMGCVLNDVYPKFTPFIFSGNDQSKQYGRYGRYGKYGRYGRYGNYGHYGNYGSYGNYGNLTKERAEK